MKDQTTSHGFAASFSKQRSTSLTLSATMPLKTKLTRSSTLCTLFRNSGCTMYSSKRCFQGPLAGSAANCRHALFLTKVQATLEMTQQSTRRVRASRATIFPSSILSSQKCLQSSNGKKTGRCFCNLWTRKIAIETLIASSSEASHLQVSILRPIIKPALLISPDPLTNLLKWKIPKL